MALHKEDAWLIKSVGYKVLSIRDDPIAFAIELRDFREKDPERFERLFGICERLEFVEQLRHTARMAIGHEYTKERQALYQLDRLTTYLMTTCIDIATGKSFESYKVWLARNYKDLDIEDDWNAAIRMLSDTTDKDKAEVARLFVKSTARIHEKLYEPNMSVRRGFVDFICNMDGWFKEWLFNDKYVIQLSSSDIFSEDFQEPRWETLDTDGKCERIAHYLYDVRNLYTHTVNYYAPYGIGRFSVSYGDYGVTVFPPSKPFPYHRFIFLPRGLLESDVIRLLIVIWLRKNWLSIKDDESAVQKYWDRVEYRRFGFNFLAELEENQRLIENWCSHHLSPLWQELSSDVFQLQTLYDTHARMFLDKHREMFGGSPSLCHPDSYLASIEKLNAKIADYNTRHAKLDRNTRRREIDKLFAEISELPETRYLYHDIEGFHRDSFRRLDDPLY